jgi:hypothetical protein
MACITLGWVILLKFILVKASTFKTTPPNYPAPLIPQFLVQYICHLGVPYSAVALEQEKRLEG